MRRKMLSLLPLALLFALMLAPTTGATENGVYAILYSDKTLVFQYGDAPESGRTVTKMYPVNLGGGAPWSDKRSTIKAVVFKDAIQPLSMAYWFEGFSSLESIQGLDKVDTSNLVSIAGLFVGCSKFTEMDLRGLDTSNVTDMWEVFKDCKRLTSLNVSDWDTSSVTNMQRMFMGCSSLKTLDLSGFDTRNLTDMSYMFVDCSNLTALDLSAFNTSEVTSMTGVFAGCSSLKTLDLHGFDTSNVIDMMGMFETCSGLTTINLGNFDTSSVSEMYAMFRACSSLTTLDLSGFDTSAVTNMACMFSNCTSLVALDVRHFDTSNVTRMDEMFHGCSSLSSLDISGFDTSNVTNMEYMFSGCASLATLNISGFNTFFVTRMYYMFWGCSNLTTLDLSSFETSNVMDMTAMFACCDNLRTIYASKDFVIPSTNGQIVFPLYTMFAGCTSLAGGGGTKYDPSHTDAEYARIDNPPDAPGYFTDKKTSVAYKPVTLTLKLRDSSGKAVTMDDVRKGAEIAPEITVEDDAPELKTADIFLAIYDSKGMMLSLQSWEVDLSNPLSFIRTTPIPQGVDASYVKFIMLSSNLTPLTAAQALQ